MWCLYRIVGPMGKIGDEGSIVFSHRPHLNETVVFVDGREFTVVGVIHGVGDSHFTLELEECLQPLPVL